MFNGQCWLLVGASFRKLVLFLGVFLVMANGGMAIAHEDEEEHSHAQDAAKNPQQLHEENVEELLNLMGIPQQVDQAARDFMRLYAVRDALVGKNESYQKLIDVYHDSVEQVVLGVLSWQSMKGTYINSYARRMTAEEVTGVSNFLRSPPGQKFITTQQQVSGDIKEVTAHLAEADLTPALTRLRTALTEGIQKIQAANQNNESE